METTFKIKTEEFYPAIKKIAKLIPTFKKVGNVKITVQPMDIVISCPGIEMTIPAETSGYADVIVPFILLYAIHKTEKVTNLTFTFTQGTIKTEKITINNPRILVNSLFTTKEIDLPLNATSLDILRLRITHSPDELGQYNMLDKLLTEEKKLDEDLLQITHVLYKFGITRQDILDLILKKLEE